MIQKQLTLPEKPAADNADALTDAPKEADKSKKEVPELIKPIEKVPVVPVIGKSILLFK
jgi:hypothetical protein